MRHQFVRSLAGSRDPNFKNVTLLLHGDGTNGGQNNTFLDSGPNNLTITRNGSVPQGSFSPYGDRWSNYFDGTGDSLTLASNAAFAIGNGQFTMEFWIQFSVLSNIQEFIRTALSDQNGPFVFYYTTSNNTLNIGPYAGVGGGGISVSWTPNLHQWYHIAASRDSSNTQRLFIDGILVGSSTSTANYTQSGFGIFQRFANFNGYFSNFRFVNGTAIYTSNFTVPTAPLTAVPNTVLLTCQSNRFRDASSNNFTVTRNGDVSVQRFSPFSPDAEYRTDRIAGSAYFSGANSNSLSVSSATANIDTNPFTVESWVYYLGTNNQAWFTPAPGIPFTVIGTTLRVFYATGFLSAGPIERNAWTHIAVTRDFSNVLRVFVNGVLNSSTITTTAFNSTTPIIGERFGNGTPFVGYIAGFRLLIHTPLYTSNFTPPTSPPTVINDTRWLVNFTDASVRDNAMMNNLQTVGNAQISTSVKKYGTGSFYFDGTGDYLQIAATRNLNLSSGDWTVECWWNPSANVAQNIVMVNYNAGTDGYAHARISTSVSPNKFYALSSSTGTSWLNTTGGGSWSINNWYHLAFVRNGSTFTLFVNGTSVLSYTSSSTLFAANGISEVGRTSSSAGQFYYVNGYIDDLRITKGVARYTANFIPPTAPFPDF